MTDFDAIADAIIQKATSKPPEPPSQDEVDTLIALFAPSKQSVHSKAYLALSALRENVSPSHVPDNPVSNAFLRPFLSAIDQRMSDVEESSLVEGMSFTSALFTVDRQAATNLFTREGFQDSMMDSLDLFVASTDIPRTVAQLLAQACGHKSCATALSPRCPPWLESTFRKTKDEKLKGLVALALLKLSRAPKGDLEGDRQRKTDDELGTSEAELYSAMRIATVSGDAALKDLTDAIEGLAYFSTIPSFKEKMSKDTQLIRRLVSFHSQLRSKTSLFQLGIPGTVLYGLCTIVADLCAYRPKLSDEEAQIVRLKKMAQPKSPSGPDVGSRESDDTLDDDEHVRERGKRLVGLGAVDLLVSVSKVSDSTSVQMTIGRALLSLVENKDNRGKILQLGGAKALMTVIHASQAKTKKEGAHDEAEYSDLPTIQALAKLAITSSPMQVFGPNDVAALDAVNPLSCLLLHPQSTLLQRFEALMALTNLSSSSPELASRIADTKGLLSKVEFLLLDDNTLVRRAATELVCNLVSGSETVFDLFSGEGEGDRKSGVKQSKSRLHVLVALSDVEDEPTRLAASGALAVLSGSPTASEILLILELEEHRVFPVLKRLLDPDDGMEEASPQAAGLIHRGVVCVRNILVNSEESGKRKVGEVAREQGLVSSLTTILKGANSGKLPAVVIQTSAEALKWLVDSGIEVP